MLSHCGRLFLLEVKVLLEKKEYRDLIPPLSAKEYAGLEQSCIKEGIREAIIAFDGFIIDGHHRYEIAKKHGLEYRTIEMEFNCKDDVLIWIIDNQFARRNLLDIVKAELALMKKAILAARGRANIADGQERRRLKESGLTLSTIDKDTHNTQAELSGMLGWSTGKFAQAEIVIKKATPELLKEVHSGEKSINEAYTECKKKEKIERLKIPITEDTSKKNIKLFCADMLLKIPTIGKFDLIIADPPYNVTEWEWDKIGSDFLPQTKKWLQVCKDALKEQYHLFWFCSPSYAADIEMIFRELNLPILSRIVWHRRNMSMGSVIKNKFIDSWEMIFHSGNRELNLPTKWDDKRFDVQTFAVPQTNFTDMKIHPTQKPIELIKILVEFGSHDGCRVLDPFAGSGVTAASCDHREYVLIERNKEYATTIKNRFNL